jgi:hypothetical protein
MIVVADPRADWRLSWLGCIRELADLQEQRATWLNRENGNPHYSYVECCCSYFDDLSLGEPDSYFMRMAEGIVGREEVAAVAQLHALLSAYSPPGDDDGDHSAILSDPGWQAITEEARRAIDRLSALLSEPEELRALLQPSAEGLRASRAAGSA